MKSEQIVAEARAKFIWGEPPAQVFKYLQDQSVGEKQAYALIATFKKERHLAIRSLGMQKIIRGAPLISVPFIAYAVFCYITVIYVKIFALCIFVGLYGVWKVLSGVFQIMAPQTEGGDISKMSD